MNKENIRTVTHIQSQILNSQAVENHLGGVYPISREKEQPFFQSDILPMYKSPMYERSIDYVKVIGWRNITVDSYNKQIREFIFGMNLPKIIKGDKLIADAPIVEAGRTLLNTNEEMEVVDVWINNEDMGEGAIIKYYYCQVRAYSMDKYNEFMIRIIHEDSEEFYKKILSLQAKLANSYPKGSFQARSAWIDYYKFIEHWHQVKYSYAITAHKSQGSTYENAYVLKWDIEMNRDVFERNRILYTACTRPSKNLFIVV
jgi:exodeoxyribonuclease-5